MSFVNVSVICNCTQLKMNNLFWPDENSIEQCFAANIVQCCQQYCSTLLHLIAGLFRLNNTLVCGKCLELLCFAVIGQFYEF